MKRNLLDPFLVHPRTGISLTPQMFQGKRGLVVVPQILGGAPDDGEPGAGSGEGGTGSGGAGTGSTDPAGGTSGTGSTDAGSGEGEEEKVPLSKFKQQEAQLREADRKRAEYERKLQEIADKDKSELERATSKAQQLETTVTKLQEEVQNLRVQNAFLMGNSYVWHDAEDALALAQRKGFLDDAINKETGEVDQNKVKIGLKNFAEKHKHLIKEAAPGQGDGNGTRGQQGTATPPPVGSNGAGNKGGKGIDDAALRNKFRALRN